MVVRRVVTTAAMGPATAMGTTTPAEIRITQALVCTQTALVYASNQPRKQRRALEDGLGVLGRALRRVAKIEMLEVMTIPQLQSMGLLETPAGLLKSIQSAWMLGSKVSITGARNA